MQLMQNISATHMPGEAMKRDSRDTRDVEDVTEDTSDGLDTGYQPRSPLAGLHAERPQYRRSLFRR